MEPISRLSRSAANHAMASPSPLPYLPEEVLEDIFLRLSDVADLARASAVCTSFRRVVSARGFLRRVRSHHAPPVLGFLYGNNSPGFLPADAPLSAAPAGRALARAADFTFSFLPGQSHSRRRWRVRDARDGRVLLSQWPLIFPDLVIADPLHRRYVQIPRIPYDLVASLTDFYMLTFEPFLAPATDEEKEEEILPFRVICNVLCEAKLATFVFSSVTGEWRGVTSFSFPTYGQILHPGPGSLVRYYVSSRFYWTHDSWNYLLVLDTREMKFSIAGLPPNSHGRRRAIFDAGEDRVGLLTLAKQTLELHWKTLRDSGFGVEEWQHGKMIPLPDDGYPYTILDAAEGYLLLRGAPQYLSSYTNSLPQRPESQYFTLELKTLTAERLCSSNQSVCHAGAHLYRYASLPPPLSLPSI